MKLTGASLSQSNAAWALAGWKVLVNPAIPKINATMACTSHRAICIRPTIIPRLHIMQTRDDGVVIRLC